MYSVKYNKIFIDLMDKIVEVYAANTIGVSLKRLKLLHKFTLIIELILKIGTTVYILAGIFYPIDTVYTYYAPHKKLFIVNLFMPFIDENTTSGFVILTAIHLIYMGVFIIGSAAVDFMFAMMIINVQLLSTIFNENVEELNAILSATEIDELSSKAKLRNISLMHREIHRFELPF